MEKNSQSSYEYRDMSSEYRLKEEQATVDQVYINQNQDGHEFIKIRLRIDRVPIVGDKFSSRHAQTVYFSVRNSRHCTRQRE